MNKLTVVCDKLIYKRYGLTEKCENEFKAWKQFNTLVPENVPVLYKKTLDLCVFEYILQSSKKQNKRGLSKTVAEMMIKIYSKYKPTAYKKGSLWKNSVNQLKSDFKSLKPILLEMGEKETFNKIAKFLLKIEKTEFINITFLHRDIHKGNILNDNQGFYLIDHEHAIEGPIELELQNSIFWNDKMSLNAKIVKNEIKATGVDYSENAEKLLYFYYLADQLVLAYKDNKPKKILKLINKAKKAKAI